MKLKKTKWVDHKYSAEELEAQKYWDSARKRRGELLAGLKTTHWFTKREDYHKRLDQLLDSIEKAESKARVLFPEVKESFTLFEGKLF